MNAGPEEIAQAVARLRAGGLVAFPTETVYGLGAMALDPDAVDLVFRAKGRPSNNPLIVHVTGAEMARRLCAHWPERADRLAQEFWPGPLTLVLERAACVPGLVTAGGTTVALRCPDHPLSLALMETLDAPLVGPSANPSGSISPTTAEHVRAAFDEATVFVIDGGPCRGGIESTVVDLTGARPRVLRPGLIGRDRIARVLGETVDEGAAGEGPARSPGVVGAHYRPRTPATMFDARDWPGVLSGGRSVVITHVDREAPPPHEVVRMPGDARAYAARLYAALHEADARLADILLVERPPTDGADAVVWEAIAERLARATSPG